MNRSLVVTMLTLPVVWLSLASSEAPAQQCCYPAQCYPAQCYAAQCCPQPGSAGTYLSPSSAFPTAAVYYPAATTADPSAQVHYHLASAKTQSQQPMAAAVQPSQQVYVYTQCCCERCRREREGGLPAVFRGLWELEQRKNAFLRRAFFGD